MENKRWPSQQLWRQRCTRASRSARTGRTKWNSARPRCNHNTNNNHKTNTNNNNNNQNSNQHDSMKWRHLMTTTSRRNTSTTLATTPRYSTRQSRTASPASRLRQRFSEGWLRAVRLASLLRASKKPLCSWVR